MAEIKVTKNNFNSEVLNADLPVLVDFWASWCGPCKMLAPVLSRIADEYEGKAIVAKVNVDEEPELASQFRILSIPTVILFKDGKPAGTSVGLVPKEQLVQMLE